MSNLSIDINDDTLAALLVAANSKDTSLSTLVDSIITSYVNNYELEGADDEVTEVNTSVDSQLLVERQAIAQRDSWVPPVDKTVGCCGGEVERGQQEPTLDTPPEPVAEISEEDVLEPEAGPEEPIPNGSDLDIDNKMNRPINNYKPAPKGAPLYNPKSTNSWL